MARCLTFLLNSPNLFIHPAHIVTFYFVVVKEFACVGRKATKPSSRHSIMFSFVSYLAYASKNNNKHFFVNTVESTVDICPMTKSIFV